MMPVWHQAIIWTNSDLLSIGPMGINLDEMSKEIQTFSFKKMYLNLSAKWQPFCSSLNATAIDIDVIPAACHITISGCLMYDKLVLSKGSDWPKWESIHTIKKAILPHSLRLWSRGGGHSTNFLFELIISLCRMIETPFVCYVSHSYLKGVTAAKMQRHLSNMNVILWI